MTEESTEVKLAVLTEQVKGIREQQKAHAETTQSMFTKLFEGLDSLKADMNRGKGVFAAALTISGVVGGIITLIVNFLSEHGHK